MLQATKSPASAPYLSDVISLDSDPVWGQGIHAGGLQASESTTVRL